MKKIILNLMAVVLCLSFAVTAAPCLVFADEEVETVESEGTSDETVENNDTEEDSEEEETESKSIFTNYPENDWAALGLEGEMAERAQNGFKLVYTKLLISGQQYGITFKDISTAKVCATYNVIRLHKKVDNKDFTSIDEAITDKGIILDVAVDGEIKVNYEILENTEESELNWTRVDHRVELLSAAVTETKVLDMDKYTFIEVDGTEFAFKVEVEEDGSTKDVYFFYGDDGVSTVDADGFLDYLNEVLTRTTKTSSKKKSNPAKTIITIVIIAVAVAAIIFCVKKFVIDADKKDEEKDRAEADDDDDGNDNNPAGDDSGKNGSVKKNEKINPEDVDF